MSGSQIITQAQKLKIINALDNFDINNKAADFVVTLIAYSEEDAEIDVKSIYPFLMKTVHDYMSIHAEIQKAVCGVEV
jgi:hypothetical protein